MLRAAVYLACFISIKHLTHRLHLVWVSLISCFVADVALDVAVALLYFWFMQRRNCISRDEELVVVVRLGLHVIIELCGILVP